MKLILESKKKVDVAMMNTARVWSGIFDLAKLEQRFGTEKINGIRSIETDGCHLRLCSETKVLRRKKNKKKDECVQQFRKCSRKASEVFEPI